MKNFSVDSYRKIIETFLDDGYKIKSNTDDQSDEKIVFLRHDIDYSLELAVKIAEINSEIGVRGCFFIQVNSVLYNVACAVNQRSLLKIIDSGQFIGLHYNIFNHGITDQYKSITQQVYQDYELLQSLMPGSVRKQISWHNPSVLGESYMEIVKKPIPGFLNAYELINKGYHYMADSNNRYSVDTWLELPKENHTKILALFHPFQWVLGASEIKEVLANTWKHLIRQKEKEFLTNHSYKKIIPAGLPEQNLMAMLAPLLDKK